MEKLICKNCGATIDIGKAVEGVVECEYCRCVFTLPRQEVSERTSGHLNAADRAMDVCHFDDAYTYYKLAVESDENEPQAYFGMALATFKVQFLKDYVNNRLQPICHAYSEKKFVEDKNYLKAINLATEKQRHEYKKIGREIDEIQEEFAILEENNLDYDCFICVKVTEKDGITKTADYDRANEIYYYLKENGYKPFFSEREIKGRTGSAYEAMILYALIKSECMLIVCSNEEYLHTSWVQNEYFRFMSLLSNDEKDHDALTFVYYHNPIDRLPNGIKRIQGIDYSAPIASELIKNYVDKHTPEAKKRKEEAERRAQEKLDKDLENQKKYYEETTQLKEALNRLQQSNFGTRSTVGSLLTRAWQEIDARDYDKASNYFQSVLDANPENSEGWWGMFVSENKVSDEKALIKDIDFEFYNKIKKNAYYTRAKKFAVDAMAERIANFDNAIEDPELWWNLFLKDYGVDRENLLINKLNYEIYTEIPSNQNYLQAKEFSKSNKEMAERIANFDNAMEDPKLWWNLFLNKFNVADEKEILESVNYKIYNDIKNSVYFNKAKESAASDVKLSNRISEFENELIAPKLWWEKIFLKGKYNVSDEAELLKRIDYKRYNEIKSSKLFNQTKEIAASDKKISARISKFEKNMEDPELWWKLFLNDYGVFNDSRLIERIDYYLYNEIPQNINYKQAKEFAATDENMLARIKAFDKAMENPELWWNAFLKEFNAKTDDELLSKVTSENFETIRASNNLKYAVQFSYNSSFGQKIQHFNDRIPEYLWHRFLTCYAENERNFLKRLLKFKYKNEIDFCEKSTPKLSEIMDVLGNKDLSLAWYLAEGKTKKEIYRFICEIKSWLSKEIKKAKKSNKKARRARTIIYLFNFVLVLCIAALIIDAKVMAAYPDTDWFSLYWFSRLYFLIMTAAVLSLPVSAIIIRIFGFNSVTAYIKKHNLTREQVEDSFNKALNSWQQLIDICDSKWRITAR